MKALIQSFVKRKFLYVLFVVITGVSTSSCIDNRLRLSGKNVIPTDQNTTSYADLTELIRTIPRVLVTGSRDLAAISVIPNTPVNPPLFVVDGVEIGNNYTQIYNLIPIDQIRRVNVLSTPDAFSRYGSRAKYGAILIETSSSL